MAKRCFFFGCWNRPGHFLHAASGSPTIPKEERRALEYVRLDGSRHLDGTLAPRCNSLGQIFCANDARDGDNFSRFMYAAECPQGQFLRHVLPNGYTAIQWWDRCQGDGRPNCNSTLLLEGEHTTEAMLTALAENFPHVLENLKRAGVELVEVEKHARK